MYAFLPREAVTKFLMSCEDCQKRMHFSNGQKSFSEIKTKNKLNDHLEKLNYSKDLLIRDKFEIKKREWSQNKPQIFDGLSKLPLKHVAYQNVDLVHPELETGDSHGVDIEKMALNTESLEKNFDIGEYLKIEEESFDSLNNETMTTKGNKKSILLESIKNGDCCKRKNYDVLMNTVRDYSKKSYYLSNGCIKCRKTNNFFDFGKDSKKCDNHFCDPFQHTVGDIKVEARVETDCFDGSKKYNCNQSNHESLNQTLHSLHNKSFLKSLWCSNISEKAKNIYELNKIKQTLENLKSPKITSESSSVDCSFCSEEIEKNFELDENNLSSYLQNRNNKNVLLNAGVPDKNNVFMSFLDKNFHLNFSQKPVEEGDNEGILDLSKKSNPSRAMDTDARNFLKSLFNKEASKGNCCKNHVKQSIFESNTHKSEKWDKDIKIESEKENDGPFSTETYHEVDLKPKRLYVKLADDNLETIENRGEKKVFFKLKILNKVI